MKKLGLDLSTATCGYCISEDRNIIIAGYLDISKGNNYKEKAEIIINKLKEYQFDVIQVEEALLGFQFGRTSSKTIVSLIANKSVVCYILEEYFKIPVNFYNVNTMRKQLFGACRVKGLKSKEFVNIMLKNVVDTSKFLVYNKKGAEDKRNEDMRDAVVCSLYNG